MNITSLNYEKSFIPVLVRRNRTNPSSQFWVPSLDRTLKRIFVLLGPLLKRRSLPTRILLHVSQLVLPNRPSKHS